MGGRGRRTASPGIDVRAVQADHPIGGQVGRAQGPHTASAGSSDIGERWCIRKVDPLRVTAAGEELKRLDPCRNTPHGAESASEGGIPEVPGVEAGAGSGGHIEGHDRSAELRAGVVERGISGEGRIHLGGAQTATEEDQVLVHGRADVHPG